MTPTDALGQLVYVVLGLVIGGAALAFLYAMANVMRNEVEVHCLRVQVGALRAARIKEIRKLHGLEDDEPDVDILDDDDPDAIAGAIAADPAASEADAASQPAAKAA